MISPSHMPAAVLNAPGVPVFGEFPEPQETAGGVIVDVDVAGLNPIDVALASGAFVTGPPPVPSVPGEEGVGRTSDGRRAYFGATLSPYGSMAQRTLVDPAQLIELPDKIDDATAVGLGIAGLAGWLPLVWRAALQPGETVLILGATGAVGRIAVQAARIRGAGRVVAAGRDARGLERALELGADATVDLSDTDDLAGAFRQAADGDVDVVIDPLWGAPAAAALAAGSPRVRLVQVGTSAGPQTAIDASALRGKDISILSYSSFTTRLDVTLQAYGELLDHAIEGRLVVDLERHPLRDVAQAWARQQAGAREKILLVP